MSILASDILEGSYQLLGRPSLHDLPYLDLLVLVRDVARGRILDLKLAARNHTMQIGAWVTPSAREMSTAGFVGGLEQFIPVRVEWRYLAEANVTPAVMPRRVEVAPFDQLGELFDTGETYCSFYDGFASIAFGDNSDTLSLRQYRIVYEDTSDIALTAVTHYVELPDVFVTLCKYEAALTALNQVRNQAPNWADERERLRADFLTQVSVWSQRFEKFSYNRYGNKKVKKVGFRPRSRIY
jgi:hypothetical protein